jgi:nucleotide-binding universal stress UspA family protein
VVTVFDSIVIATDGSAHGDRALQLARSLLSSQTARLSVVHVNELVSAKGAVYPRAADEDQRRARIAAQVEDLQGAGIKAEFLNPTIRLGGAAHVIAELAESLPADLIIVGSKGHSLVSKIVLGSVPIRLLQIAPCPVLVVPLPDAPEPSSTH